MCCQQPLHPRSPAAQVSCLYRLWDREGYVGMDGQPQDSTACGLLALRGRFQQAVATQSAELGMKQGSPDPWQS